jgi:transposase
VIADAARVMPHTLRRVDVGEEALAELKVLVGFDDDLAAEATRLTNRLRGLLTQVHPALEWVLGPRIHTKAAIALIGRYGGPAGLHSAGRGRLLQTARKANPRGATELIDQLWTALQEQTVVVPGTAAAETVLPKLAASLHDTLDQRAAIAAEVEQVLDAHPLAPVLTSMPGVGVRTAARILLDVGDASTFPTAGHLAASAGPAPVTRQSGISRSGANIHPAAATNTSHVPCSSPHSPPYELTRSAGPTSTANATRGNDTTPPSSASPDAAAMSSTP